ncbi:MAG: 2-C-methyl-D-erythritol 4-phosphate cytidylyltransferase [Treponema sp.]|nr:2-C-methyl-D-erythritol 4-phosphate cytidylyltransferase [Treponema sp.]
MVTSAEQIITSEGSPACAALSIAAVICAAGSSSRMGGVKKEYQKLNDDVTVLGSSVRVLASIPSIEFIVITIPVNTETAARNALPPHVLAAGKPKILFVTGGDSRRASVFNALSLLASYNPCYVLIHDGARPWINTSLVINLIEAVIKYSAVIPLLPLTDTPKECGLVTNDECGLVTSVECGVNSEEGGKEGKGKREERKEKREEGGVRFIERHLRRVDVGVAQTPQCFKFLEILDAHKKAAGIVDEEFTDDAEIWGRFNGKVAVIPGDPKNKKITYKEDLY